MKSWLALFFVFGSLSLPSAESIENLSELRDERTWTGKNGKHFRGVFATKIKGSGALLFYVSTGKPVEIAFENLSEKDQKVITLLLSSPVELAALEQKAAEKENSKFVQIPHADRSFIPAMSPEGYGLKSKDPVVDSLWLSFLWWDRAQVMPIPERGDYEKKAKWLHKELTRYVGESGDRVASLLDVKEGLEKYCERHLKEIGEFRISVHGPETDIQSIQKLVTRNTIVIGYFSMEYHDERDIYSCPATFESMGEDQTFSVRLYGAKIRGKFVPFKLEKPQMIKMAPYKMEIANIDALPRYRQDNIKQIYNAGDRWTGFITIEPLRYVKKPEDSEG